MALQRLNLLYIFVQQLQSGINDLVPEAQEKLQPCFYLPYYGVVRQDKDTTTLCIVFDGLVKTKSTLSLNDCVPFAPLYPWSTNYL